VTLNIKIWHISKVDKVEGKNYGFFHLNNIEGISQNGNTIKCKSNDNI
jgi:hypothetical protein